MKTPWGKTATLDYQKQEHRKRPGARPQINSGRVWTSLRDVKQRTAIGTFLMDCKTTDKLSFCIEKSAWKKLKRDANRQPPGCLPMLQIDIGEVHLVVIEEAAWENILNFMNGSKYE